MELSYHLFTLQFSVLQQIGTWTLKTQIQNSPEINSGIYGQIIYNKGHVNEYTMEKRQSLQ